MKKTPLYECHVKHGAKLVAYAGYSLPVQYGRGLIAEHMNVRERCGLFDVSHMTELFFEGEDALANVQMIFPNDYAKAKPGQVKYTTMLNDGGGIVDDLIIYKFSDENFMAVGNGANHAKDFDWISARVTGRCAFTDRSADFAQLALQGPSSPKILGKLASEETIPGKYYTFREGEVAGFGCIVSQTGYTGEMGYELYTAPENAAALWDELLAAGEEYGLIPCGLGARDTLRLEAGMPLYGHEMTDEITPLEAGLGFSVKLSKEDFIGKAALNERAGSDKTLAGFKITGRGIVREHCDIFIDGEKIGVTTSGTQMPYLGYPVALGYIDKRYAEPGTRVSFNVRGRDVAGEVVRYPFYKRA